MIHSLNTLTVRSLFFYTNVALCSALMWHGVEQAKIRSCILWKVRPIRMRMHLIGMENTVASWFGTTDEQFQLISRAANKICFLPNYDPPKDLNYLYGNNRQLWKTGNQLWNITVCFRQEIPDDNHQGRRSRLILYGYRHIQKHRRSRLRALDGW